MTNFILYIGTFLAISAIIVLHMGERMREFLWNWIVHSALMFLFIFIAMAGGFVYFGANFKDARLTAWDTLFANQDAATWSILVFCGLGLLVTLKRGRRRK